MSMTKMLRGLGFKTYKEYLNSEVWEDFKRRYRASGRPVQCVVCKFPLYQLHHVTYDRLGCEDVSDVIPLCRIHHDAVHLWLRVYGKGKVENTAAAIEWLRRPQSEQTPPTVPTTKLSKKSRCPKCHGYKEAKFRVCKRCHRRWKKSQHST